MRIVLAVGLLLSAIQGWAKPEPINLFLLDYDPGKANLTTSGSVILTQPEQQAVQAIIPALSMAFQENSTTDSVDAKALAAAGVATTDEKIDAGAAKSFSKAWSWRGIDPDNSFIATYHYDELADSSLSPSIKKKLTEAQKQYPYENVVELRLGVEDADNQPRSVRFVLIQPRSEATTSTFILMPTPELILARGESFEVNPNSPIGKSLIARRNATRDIIPIRGEAAPELDAWELETSKPLSLSALKGKIVLLDFWATWCGPCQPNMQKLIDIAAELPADLQEQVALITISVDEKPDEVKKRLKEKGWESPHVRHYWYGPSPSDGGPYGVSSIPHAVIIAKDGRIAVPDYHVGDNLVETLRKLQE